MKRNPKRSAALLLLMITLLVTHASVYGQFGPDASSSADTLDTIVAVVGDDIVTRLELERTTASTRRQLLRARGEAKLPPQAIIERQVLERLILEQLQQRAAAERGITVDDTALNGAVSAIASRNKMSLKQLRQAVERDGSNYVEYREQIRREMIATRLRQREIDSQIRITEQEIDNVIEANLGGKEFHIAQIMVAVPHQASVATVEKARAKVTDILARLRGGADFGRLAADVSDSREALEGGDLGWRKRGQLPSLFAGVVVRLKDGQVSAPIRSPSGFHLIKLLASRVSEAPSGNAEARQAVREQLLRRKSEEEWDLWLRRLRDESYVEVRLP